MSTVEELCRLLCAAAGIIRQQAALLEMHGIGTQDGALENERRNAMDAIREMAGEDGAHPPCEKGEKNNADADNIPPFSH